MSKTKTKQRQPPVAERIAEKVLELRLSREWSQVELAEKLGGTWVPQRIYELEAATYACPRIERLEELAKVFGVTVLDLLE